MNAGAYVTGSQLKRLGEYYAKAIHDNYGDDFDVLFGPAYKGIPLAVVTAIAYSELYGKEVRYCSDRKEAKDHGADKGGFLGSSLKDGDRVVMIEDVTTSGKSMEKAPENPPSPPNTSGRMVSFTYFFINSTDSYPASISTPAFL
jgi:orotate phosphoribosyltransferase